MSAQHTPGRLRYDYEPGFCGELLHDNGTTMCTFVDEPSEANARRLVACWNWCEGQDTDGLALSVELGRTAKHFIDEACAKELELITQRDELLQALKDIAEESTDPGAVACARAAIAKAGGEA